MEKFEYQKEIEAKMLAKWGLENPWIYKKNPLQLNTIKCWNYTQNIYLLLCLHLSFLYVKALLYLNLHNVSFSSNIQWAFYHNKTAFIAVHEFQTRMKSFIKVESCINDLRSFFGKIYIFPLMRNFLST